MFAGSCIGVVCLVVALEFLRRVQREYARWIERSSRLGAARVSFSASSDGGSDEKHGGAATARAVERSPSGSVRGRVDSTTLLKRHLVRSALHTMLFGVAYIVMLIAMSFNGEDFVVVDVAIWVRLSTSQDISLFASCSGRLLGLLFSAGIWCLIRKCAV